MRVARAGQHPVQFDIGAGARGDAAEDLEDGFFLEHDAGVALLGAQHPRRGVHRQHDVGLLAEPHIAAGWPTVADESISDSRYLAAAGVVERVVCGAVVVGADGRDGGILVDRARIPLHDHLIALGRAVRVGRVEQHQIQILAQRHCPRRCHRRQLTGAAGIPALLREPLRPWQVRRLAHDACSSDARSSNQ